MMSRPDERNNMFTAYEQKLYDILQEDYGQFVTKQKILSILYDHKKEPDIKIIDVMVCKMRRKMLAGNSDKHIETVGGRGYLLRNKIITPVKEPHKN